MSEQLTNGNGLLAASGELGQVPVDPIAEPNLSVLHQQHDRRCCGHDLSQRGHVKDCVRGHWLHQRFQSALAEGFQVCNLPAPAHEHYGPGRLFGLDSSPDRLIDVLQVCGPQPDSRGRCMGQPFALGSCLPLQRRALQRQQEQQGEPQMK